MMSTGSLSCGEATFWRFEALETSKKLKNNLRNFGLTEKSPISSSHFLLLQLLHPANSFLNLALLSSHARLGSHVRSSLVEFFSRTCSKFNWHVNLFIFIWLLMFMWRLFSCSAVFIQEKKNKRDDK